MPDSVDVRGSKITLLLLRVCKLRLMHRNLFLDYDVIDGIKIFGLLLNTWEPIGAIQDQKLLGLCNL